MKFDLIYLMWYYSIFFSETYILPICVKNLYPLFYLLSGCWSKCFDASSHYNNQMDFRYSVM
uniref:Uncharacterized protein n=1 Tax=Rhizophora mucronata TaxID=61149 RepID=A0A2P2Q552_RHIMU